MKNILFLSPIFAIFFSFTFAQTPDNNTTLSPGMKFPSFSANNLNNTSVSVPDPVSPAVEIAVMTFSRQDIEQTDNWINTFNAIYKDNDAVIYSQTAVTGDIPIIGGLILNGMKSALPKEKWDRFLIYTGNKDFLTKTFGVDDPRLFYVYVIGKDGLIKWMIKSPAAADAEIKAMLEAVKKELSAGIKPVKNMKNKL